MDFSKLNPVGDSLPSNGRQYLCLLNDPYASNSGTPYFTIAFFDTLNNSFEGFPAGAREVTHWMSLDELVDDNGLSWSSEDRKFVK